MNTMQIIGYKNIIKRKNSRSLGIPIFKVKNEKNDKYDLVTQKIDTLKCICSGYNYINEKTVYESLPDDIELDFNSKEPIVIYIDWNGNILPLTYKEFLFELLHEFDVQNQRPDPYFYFEMSFFLKVPSIIDEQRQKYNRYLLKKGIRNCTKNENPAQKLELSQVKTVIDFYSEIIGHANWDIENEIVSIKNDCLFIGQYYIPLSDIEVLKSEINISSIYEMETFINNRNLKIKNQELTAEAQIKNKSYKYENQAFDIITEANREILINTTND